MISGEWAPCPRFHQQLRIPVSVRLPLAKWETRFDPQSTSKQDFHVTPETVVQVPMMKREDEYDYLLDRRLYCRVVGLPYQGNATALFILPSEGRMQKVEAGLDQETLTKWLKKFTKRYLQAALGQPSPAPHQGDRVPRGHHQGAKDSPSPGAASEPRGIRGVLAPGPRREAGLGLDACFPGGAVGVGSELRAVQSECRVAQTLPRPGAEGHVELRGDGGDGS